MAWTIITSFADKGSARIQRKWIEGKGYKSKITEWKDKKGHVNYRVWMGNKVKA